MYVCVCDMQGRLFIKPLFREDNSSAHPLQDLCNIDMNLAELSYRIANFRQQELCNEHKMPERNALKFSPALKLSIIMGTYCRMVALSPYCHCLWQQDEETPLS